MYVSMYVQYVLYGPYVYCIAIYVKSKSVKCEVGYYKYIPDIFFFNTST